MIRTTAALVVCLAAATNGFAADPASNAEQDSNEFMLPVMVSDSDSESELTDDVQYTATVEAEAAADAAATYEGDLDAAEDADSTYEYEEGVSTYGYQEETMPEYEEAPGRFVGDTPLPFSRALRRVAGVLGAEPMADAEPAATDGDMINGCDTCCCTGPTWYGRIEALWLKRTRVRPMTLSVDDISPGGDLIVADTDALKFDYRPGGRVTIGHYLNDCRALEFSYFSVDRHTSSAKTPFSPGGDIDPYWGDDTEEIDLRNFSNAFQHFYRYESKLHNAEINIREIRDSNSSVLAGIRYIQIDEDFRFLSFDSDDVVIALNPDDIGLYDIDARNHMVGLQVGGEKRWGADRLQIGARGKAGVFLNFYEQTSVLLDINQENTPRARTNLKTKNDDVGFAAVLDLGLFATCKLSDCISLRAGYDVFFINNVALAPDQLDSPQWLNSRTKLSNNGSVIYHGPSAGIQMNW